MSIIGNYNIGNPNITGSEDADFNDITVNNISVAQKLAFEEADATDEGNMTTFIWQDPTTHDVVVNNNNPLGSFRLQYGNTPNTNVLSFEIDSYNQHLNFPVGYSSENTITFPELYTLTGIHTYETIQQQIDSIINISSGIGYWGTFWSTIDQVSSSVNTPITATLNAYDASNNGIVLSNSAGGGNYNTITIQESATYSITISYQISSSTSSTALFQAWFQVNGVDIPQSSAGITNHNNNNYDILTYNVVMRLQANDVITLKYAKANSGVHLEALPAQTSPYTAPASPSVYISLVQVMYYQDNTAVVNSLQAELTDLSGDYYPFKSQTNTDISSLNSRMGTAESNISALQTGLATLGATVAGLATASLAQGTAIVALQGQMTAVQASVSTLQGSVATLQTKTQNMGAIVGTTNMTGLLDVDSINTDTITLNTTMTGLGKINLASTTGAHTIYSPSFSVGSTTGTGGIVSLGGLADQVFVNGLPFSFYFAQF